SSLLAAITPTTFPLTTDPIDVVIPCAPKDAITLERCITGIQKNGAHLGRIIVVSKEKMTDRAEWFSEDAFPFTKEQIAHEAFHGDESAAYEFIHRRETRIGWLFQQLLKFYAPFVIPDLSPNVLILDADVIFLKPVTFMNDKGEPYFTPSSEPIHAPYFEHGERLIPGWHRVYPQVSGIAHHMLFQRCILEDLFQTIRQTHGEEPWKAICHTLDLEAIGFAAMSEYELYFNYTQLRTKQGSVRPLRWTLAHSLHHLQALQNVGYIYICCPTWLSASFSTGRSS
ncbi:MAG: hypothetical protein HY069_01565, partial [Chlamydiia bacterium]|nr:hypothetical protein [Chlamydiia bacterium]